MTKQMKWKQQVIPRHSLAEFCTRYNFQPGKFMVIAHPGHFLAEDLVTILFVEKEEL